MKAATWQGKRDVRVQEVPDPRIEEPTDAIVEVTSTAVCGSDLHLYEVLGPFMTPGDVLGHEPIGIVRETGNAVPDLKPGDRVVVPFNIACGQCYYCSRRLYTQCERTRASGQDKGAALFGYTKLYGQVPGGQAELLRVPQAHFGPVKVPETGPDERYLFLSDVLPTAWQAVEYASVPDGGSCVVLGLGPIGQLAARIARYRGAGTVLGVDLVDERLAMAQRHGIDTLDLRTVKNVGDAVRERTESRGADAVIDAVGMEAHGAPVSTAVQQFATMLPNRLAEKAFTTAGVDRMSALYTAIDAVRRGGTVSLSGVYGGMADPMPMMTLFDKQIQLRMGQANVRAWTDEILPLLTGDDDPLGVDDLTTHRLPLEAASDAYAMFQAKRDGAIKVVLQP